jgi:hypothetical protein
MCAPVRDKFLPWQKWYGVSNQTDTNTRVIQMLYSHHVESYFLEGKKNRGSSTATRLELDTYLHIHKDGHHWFLFSMIHDKTHENSIKKHSQRILHWEKLRRYALKNKKSFFVYYKRYHVWCYNFGFIHSFTSRMDGNVFKIHESL